MENMTGSEKTFFETLQAKLQYINYYENLNLLKQAADIVPMEDLNMKATLKLSILEDSDSSISIEDLLLLELLNWFKLSFFNWVDSPKCEKCGQITQQHGVVPPVESEIKWSARNVECYQCTKCQTFIRFPRYNNPQKLLETRCGRCGEWANCFTLFCRALGYEARIVFDWNDHVWTEVFSFAKNRWLHCDPCENICDKPLLYEAGWKKPMSYVIAFSKDEVQDVTWRYTSNFSATLSRRTLCREEWLVNCILTMIEELQMNSSPARKAELAKRRVLELASFLTEPEVDEDYGGRTSGSLAWRIARGETQIESNKEPFVFSLTDKEIAAKYFHISYSCALDKYIRVSDGHSECDSWMTCAFDYKNIFRKVESDWKMVYLARTEDSEVGSISWKFNFIESGLTIRQVEMQMKNEVFENGEVWVYMSSTPDKYYSESKSFHFSKTEAFEGCTGLEITTKLIKGSGKAAWQHAQLFRQSIDDVSDFPFEIKVWFQ